MAYTNFVGGVMTTLLLLAATVLLLEVEGASLKLDKAVNPFNEDLWSKRAGLEQKWQVQTVIPSYLQNFLKLVQQTSGGNNGSGDGDEASQYLEGIEYRQDFFDQLFDGVASDSCKGHVTEWFKRISIENIKNLLGDRDKWVVQMVDAWGKIPEGVLSGHINSYGDFDECVQIKVKDLQILNDIYQKENIKTSFGGQYCTSYIFDYTTAMEFTPKPVKNTNGVTEHHLVRSNISVRRETPSVTDFLKMYNQLTFMPMLPSVAVCLPNSCSVPDVQQILVNGLALRYSGSPEYPEGLLWPLTINCVDGNKPSLDGAAIAVIILLATLATLALTTGTIDYLGIYASSDKTVYKYLMAFSFYTNTKKWLSTKKSADDLGCLHGLRFLSTAWVVLAHTYYMFIAGPQWNIIDIKNIYKDWTVLAVINGTFSVDTFFVMSGMLATYSILKMLDKTKGKFNIIMFYVHRYVRLTPTYMILVGIAATLVSYTGNGPSWTGMVAAEEYCRKNWWTNMLYINNLYNTAEMCNGESWYLANDMQFYILSPLIVYPIWRRESMGVILLSIYTVLSCIAPVLVVRYSGAPPALAPTGSIAALDPTEIYFRPWSRISAFLAGIWLGWILHKTREKRVRFPRILVLTLWLCSTGIALSVLFGIFPWFDPNNEISTVSSYFYAGLSRFSWGVAISWIIFACVKGYGGIINKFLSWKVFMPLGRLCFCVYLTSIHLQTVFVARLSLPIKWDVYTVVNLFFAHLVMSFLVAFFCSILFESPFIILQKLLFEGVGPSAKKKTSDNDVIIADSNSGNDTSDQVDKPTTSL